jgi:hypothetical protein
MNILSVDLDWIMEPSINFYEDLIEENNYFLSNLPNGVELKADLNKYAILSTLLVEKILKIKNSDIYIADTHTDILNAISKWKINKPFRIINIDHHHDCGYLNDDEDINDILKDTYCGNWVLHLTKNNLFSEYTWIGNKNSTKIDSKIKPKIPNFIFTNDIQTISNLKIDKIFICKSFEWIPENYQQMLESFTINIEKLRDKLT